MTDLLQLSSHFMVGDGILELLRVMYPLEKDLIGVLMKSSQILRTKKGVLMTSVIMTRAWKSTGGELLSY